MKVWIVMVAIIIAGCAAGSLKYDACFGFCLSAAANKEQTPEHVTNAVKP